MPERAVLLSYDRHDHCSAEHERNDGEGANGVEQEGRTHLVVGHIFTFGLRACARNPRPHTDVCALSMNLNR